MAKEKTPNYTDAQIADMLRIYVDEQGAISDVIDQVFTATNADGSRKAFKSVAQVRAKLVSLKVYRSGDAAIAKVEKADNGPAKKDLLKTLSDMGVDVKGLDSASKEGLRTVIELAEVATSAKAA